MAEVYLTGKEAPIKVGKICCVGANYASHNREMGRTKNIEPILFLKPPTALVRDGGTIRMPRFSAEVHHELEMVLLIGKAGKRIAVEDALEHLMGVAVGLDLTARDLQHFAKEHGKPWAVAKGFDDSAPISDFIPLDESIDPGNLILTLQVNGRQRQRADTSEMISGVAALISFTSQFFTLMPGDLLFTGTPEGVGLVKVGDRLDLDLNGKITASFTVVEDATAK